MGRTYPRIVTSRGTIRVFGGEWRDENAYPGELLDRTGDLVFVYLDAPGAVPILVSTTHSAPDDPTNRICRLARYERPATDAEMQAALVAAGEAAVALYQAGAALTQARATDPEALREQHGKDPASYLAQLGHEREAANTRARRAVEHVLWLRAQEREGAAPERAGQKAGTP